MTEQPQQQQTKVYHLPDWSTREKGSSLVDFALCGQDTRGPQLTHWFAMGAPVNCKACLEAQP